MNRKVILDGLQKSLENEIGPTYEGFVFWPDEIDTPKTSLQFRYETNMHEGSLIFRRMYLTVESLVKAEDGDGSEEELAECAGDEMLYDTRIALENYYSNNRSNVHNVSITEVDNQNDVAPPYALVRTDVEIMYERADSD